VLSEHERKVLISAVYTWASNMPDEPVLGFVGGTGILSAHALAQELDKGTGEGEAFLEMLEHGVRSEGLERVLERFYQSSTAVR
jgi:hypothetical protein